MEIPFGRSIGSTAGVFTQLRVPVYWRLSLFPFFKEANGTLCPLSRFQPSRRNQYTPNNGVNHKPLLFFQCSTEPGIRMKHRYLFVCVCLCFFILPSASISAVYLLEIRNILLVSQKRFHQKNSSVFQSQDINAVIYDNLYIFLVLFFSSLWHF